ncbi:MAG: hypothetical protein JSS86_04910 [Cyanobacteria bacterium SZAS LIN-2]|nr:hypothetical protein [Cyanobacteria bacterium SZAS LIN-3]MBS1995625.1 hypothetical protein [Cyanobacteria bacterium SZAS LIN-2]MBS2008380.1 hypothetical protein [Cyanobacteria bacterium SZAS TMP-1]
MAKQQSSAGGDDSFGSAANLMIEALEKASGELERTVNQCIFQLNSFTEGLDKSLSLQLEKVVAQSSHLVDTHGGDLEAKRDETLEAISRLEGEQLDTLLTAAEDLRKRFADRVREATEALGEVMDGQLKELIVLIQTPQSNLYEMAQEKLSDAQSLTEERKSEIDFKSQQYESAMSDKAKNIDEQAHKLIENSKTDVDRHLADYSARFDEKIIGVQRQLSDIVEVAVSDLKELAERGSKNIDEAKDTNHQVLNEHVEHWHTQLATMKDRFQTSSLEQQSSFLRAYNDEVERKLLASQEEVLRIATRAKQRLGTNQKLYLNSLKRVERKLSDEIDRLFFKFEAALTQEAKINLSSGGTRPAADAEVINKLHGRLKSHGAEIIKTFRRQVEHTEAEFSRSTQGSNERIESIRASSVESLEKQVKSMRTDLERITRNFHSELSELSVKLPVIEESGRAAALAVMAYKTSATLSLELD